MTHLPANCMNNDYVQIELPTQLLRKAIAYGILPSEKFKCLNKASKSTVWQTLLDLSVCANEQ